MIRVEQEAELKGQKLYSRNKILTEQERKDLDLGEGVWEEVFPIDKIPVFPGDIIQKGKKNWVKIK